MVAIILITTGILFLLTIVVILFVQHRRLTNGGIIIDSRYDGHEMLKQTCFALIRIFLKRVTHIRRLVHAYMLHVSVRFFKFFESITSHLYARSRNRFVRSAIRNKGTVPHFWEHLKTYKQEIDKEKREEE